MTIHPEVRVRFVTEFFNLRQANPMWDMEKLEEATRTKVFAESLAETNALLEQICYCPGIVPSYPESWDDEQFEKDTDDILSGYDEEEI